MTKRRFNRREKNALYIVSDGKCAQCGATLSVGWHADHIHPYSKGGETHVINGQALCQKCNLSKGASMKELIVLRPFQERFINAVFNRVRDGKKTMIADVHPGSGKTLSCLAAIDRLFAQGYFKKAIVFVPRLNLAAQFEEDWLDFSQRLPWPATMGPLYHRTNEPPLMLQGASGYIATYGSLTSQPELHLREVNEQTIIVFDEAQQLGVDTDGSTRSAEEAEKLKEKAGFVISMSGTPMRANGSRLLFAEYAETKNEKGIYPLLPNVSSSYRDGVRDSYLRPFQAELHNAEVTWLDFAKGEQTFSLEKYEGNLADVLQRDSYWQPIVDRFVEKLTEVKESVDKRLCGLISASYQGHAKSIEDYLKRRYKHLKVLIAVSDDGEDAHKNLREFRTGKYDVLVTVSMAYVGYDHKPISVMCVLTHFRSEGYLRQLLARGLRMMADVSAEKQHLYALVPDDPKMREFVDLLREESNYGYRERLEKLRNEAAKEPERQMPLGRVSNAELTDISAKGYDPAGDLDPAEFQRIEALKKQYGYFSPATELMGFHKLLSKQLTEPPPPRESKPYKTMTERMGDKRLDLKPLARSCDYELANAKFGTTYAKLSFVYRCRSTEVNDPAMLDEMIKTVMRWKAQGHYDDQK